MQLPSWLIWLSAEMIVMLVIISVWLMFAWQRSNAKLHEQILDLTDKLRQKSAAVRHSTNDQHKIHELQEQVKSLKIQIRSQTATQEEPPGRQNDGHEKQADELKQQIEALNKQLEFEKNNPFLQEKIDALLAENEDLQEEISNLRKQTGIAEN